MIAISAVQARAILQSEEDLARRAIRSGAVSSGATAGSGPNAAQPTTQTHPTHQPIDVSAVGDNIVIQGAQGMCINIYSLLLWNAGDECTLEVRDGATNLMGALTALKGSMGLTLAPVTEPYFELSPGESFVLRMTGAVAPRITGYVKFRLLPPSV